MNEADEPNGNGNGNGAHATYQQPRLRDRLCLLIVSIGSIQISLSHTPLTSAARRHCEMQPANGSKSL